MRRLQTAVEPNVTWGLVFCLRNLEGSQKQNRKILKNESFWLLRFGKFVRCSGLKNAMVSFGLCSFGFYL
jgi:hypothetical protein